MEFPIRDDVFFSIFVSSQLLLYVIRPAVA